MGYYHDVYEGGNSCSSVQDVRMNIYLYPNTSSLKGDVKSGTETTTTLRDACDAVLNAGSITYYMIDRFHGDDYSFPYIDPYNDDIGNKFYNFLKDGSKNGTSECLLDYRGAHLLIHNGDCTTNQAGADGCNDHCNDCRDDCHDTKSKGGAFSRGMYSYSPRPEACDSLGKGRNSVIQEPFHLFIRAQDPDVKDEYGDCNGNGTQEDSEEHSLGKFWESYATPMITYHESEMNVCGPCRSDTGNWNGVYTTKLTTCTKEAIGKTGDNPCISQTDC